MPRSLLLIDDDDSVRLTLAALLEDEGFQVVEAAELSQVHQCLGSHKYAAILLDWHLGGNCGQELLAPIRAHQPDAKLIVITGELRDLESVSGIDGSYQKTDDLSVLLSVLPAPTCD